MPLNDASTLAALFRKEMGEDTFSPIDVFAMANRMKNTSIVFTNLGKNISGVFCNNGQSVIIAINSSMSYGRQRFSMAHEIYHAKYDNVSGVILCPQDNSLGNENEKWADKFAACLLMPEYGIKNIIHEEKQDGPLTIENIIRIEQYYGVSHKALLVRLKELGEITKDEYNKFSDKIKATAEMLNYDTALYNPTNKEKTIGYYVALARKLHDEGMISDGKLKEILEEGFVGELVDEESIIIGEDTFE